MGDNATEGLFIGTYIFVFVVALSATIIMFNQINEYAELTYKYGKNIENSSTLVETSAFVPARLVTGDQIISYYFNYMTEETKYKINVYNNDGSGQPTLKILDKKGLKYKEVIDAIDLTQTYRIIFKEYDGETTTIDVVPYNE